MKRSHIALFALLMLSLSAQAVILDIDQIFQEMTNWCWAATSQAVLRYYGHELTQTQIAEYGTDGANEWNWLYGETSNPTRRGINLILYHFAELESDGSDYSFSYDQASSEINSMKPVFVRWGWNSGGGHFVVLKGLENTTAYLMDPWYGPTINTFNWTLAGGGHTWTHTLAMQTAPVSNEDPVAPYVGLESYPNPFHQSVLIVSPERSNPDALRIYNLKGQLVRELPALKNQSNGYSYSWDGLDASGKQVAAGLYLSRIKGDASSQTLKMLKLK